VGIFLLAHDGFFETTSASTIPPRIAFGIAVPIVVGCSLLGACAGAAGDRAPAAALARRRADLPASSAGCFLIGLPTRRHAGRVSRCRPGSATWLVGLAAPVS